MLLECARGWRIYFQIFFAVSDLPFRGSVREFPLYLLGFIDFQDLAGQRIVDDWGRFEDKKFSLLASRCGWLGPARARAVGVREECEWGRDATSRRVYEFSGARPCRDCRRRSILPSETRSSGQDRPHVAEHAARSFEDHGQPRATTRHG